MPPKSRATKSASKLKSKYGIGASKEPAIELTLPTGDVCLVRRPGVQGLIRAGVLDSFDQLTGLVKTEHLDRVEGRAETVTRDEVIGVIKDPSKLRTILDLTDKVVAYCVLDPQVIRPVKLGWAPGEEPDKVKAHEVELPDSERDADTLYTDEVPLENRMFILNFAVGGSSDLESFRDGLGKAVGHLEPSESVSLPAE